MGAPARRGPGAGRHARPSGSGRRAPARVSVEVGGARASRWRAERGRLRGPRRRRRPGDDYRFASTAATPCPTPARAASPRACAARRGSSTPAAFAWDEGGWAGLDRRRPVLYELHVGTFTPEGTFAAAAERLPALAELGRHGDRADAGRDLPRDGATGATTASTPGRRTTVYGGPGGPGRRSSTRPTGAGVGVILDVVYNHLGPGRRGARGLRPVPHRPLRDALGRGDELRRRATRGGVREWAIQNAVHVAVASYRIDGLRVDAVHAIHDEGARHVLAELVRAGPRRRAPRPPLLIAESDLNDPRRSIRPPRGRRLGLRRPVGRRLPPRPARPAHRRARRLLRRLRRAPAPGRGDRGGRSSTGASTRPSGAAATGRPADDRPPRQFVVFSQNHDQVGNRALGDRLPPRVAAPRRAVDAALARSSPMLFMGEEYGEARPVPVLHRPHRPAHRRRHPRGAAARVRRVRRLRRGGARPPGPGDRPAVVA